jgi:hypothetical protein
LKPLSALAATLTAGQQIFTIVVAANARAILLLCDGLNAVAAEFAVLEACMPVLPAEVLEEQLQWAKPSTLLWSSGSRDGGLKMLCVMETFP